MERVRSVPTTSKTTTTATTTNTTTRKSHKRKNKKQKRKAGERDAFINVSVGTFGDTKHRRIIASAAQRVMEMKVKAVKPAVR